MIKIIIYIIISIIIWLSPYLLFIHLKYNTSQCKCIITEIQEYKKFKILIILYYILLFGWIILHFINQKLYILLRLINGILLCFYLYILYYYDTILLKNIFINCNCNKSYMLAIFLYLFVIISILQIFI